MVLHYHGSLLPISKCWALNVAAMLYKSHMKEAKSD